MRHITLRAIAALFTFAIGITITTLWTATHYSYGENSSNSTPEWQKVDMEGKATFYIPANLKPVIKDTYYLYRAFRNDSKSIEFFTMYGPRNSVPACICHNDERLVPKAKLTKIIVGGREATLESLERILLDVRQEDDLGLKGMIICVQDIGDGEHELAIVGKYKNDQDYRNLQRLIDSIRFPQQ